MKRYMKKWLALPVVLALLPASVPGETTAVVNVNVLPMTSERVLTGKTVVIIDGVIDAIGDVAEIAVPEDALVVDGTDRYLMPGLTEMHAHVTGTDARDIERLFSLFLANGVTTIRGMLGRPAHLDLRADIAAGRLLGPRLITSGPSLNGNSVEGAADAARQVQRQHAAGYDFIKIHPGLDAAEFRAIAETANELGIPFAGHVPSSVGISGALEHGMATIDHLDGYLAALVPATVDTSGGYGGFFDVMLAGQADASRLEDVVSRTVSAGVANVATETLFEQLVSRTPAAVLVSRPEMRFVPADTRRRWVEQKNALSGERGFDQDVADRAIMLRRELIARLHAAGGTLLLGSDAPQVFNVPGFSLHRELELMVEAGLSPFEALKLGTTAPARFLGIDGGTVETGRAGDLVLLDDNPLDDIAHSALVHGVIVGGRWAPAAALLERAMPED